VEQRERQEESMSQTEQLLRRMTGSITAYMDTVGQRPLRMSDYDKAMLAIRDGELDAFLELYPKLLDAHADDLLIEAAGRPGTVGRKMTRYLLEDVEQFPEAVYSAACQNAIGTNDLKRVLGLLANAGDRVEDLSPSFHGEMARYAYQDHRAIAKEIIEQCSNEQIAAAPPALMLDAIKCDDFPTSCLLAERGFNADSCFSEIVRCTSLRNNARDVEYLLRAGLNVSPNNFRALHSCIEYNCPDAGKALLDKGMDLDEYECWAKGQSHGLRENDTLKALEEYWQTIQAQTQEQAAADQELSSAGQGAPIEAQRSGLDGERSRSEMSEPCPQGGANDMELAATMGGMSLG